MSTPVIRGESWKLSFGPEATWNTDPGTASIGYPLGVVQTGTMPDPEMDWQPIWAYGSSSNRNFYINYKGRLSMTGSIPDIWLLNGYPLYLPIGSVTTTGSDPYTHTISEASQLSSITMQHELFDSAGNSELIRRYSGGKTGRATYTAAEGEELRMSIDELVFASYAKTGDSGVATATITYPTTQPYIFSYGALTLWGTEFARVRAFTLEVSNALEPKYYITDNGTDRLPYEVREGRREYRMGVTIDITDSTLFDELVKWGVDHGSTSDGKFKGFDATMVFTRGTSDTITFTMPPSSADSGGDAQGCFIRSAPHNIVTDPQVSVDLDIVVRSVQIEVVDSIATYPGE